MTNSPQKQGLWAGCRGRSPNRLGPRPFRFFSYGRILLSQAAFQGRSVAHHAPAKPKGPGAPGTPPQARTRETNSSTQAVSGTRERSVIGVPQRGCVLFLSPCSYGSDQQTGQGCYGDRVRHISATEGAADALFVELAIRRLCRGSLRGPWVPLFLRVTRPSRADAVPERRPSSAFASGTLGCAARSPVSRTLNLNCKRPPGPVVRQGVWPARWNSGICRIPTPFSYGYEEEKVSAGERCNRSSGGTAATVQDVSG